MRVLMMISNSNMAARELYTLVLRERFPGWGISHMSGLPPNPGYIVKGFNVLLYELGAPDDPRRYKAVLALHDEIKEIDWVRLVTRIEGPYRDGIVAELESKGVICVGAPFSPQTIAEALQRAAPRPRAAPDSGPGLGMRLRGLFRRDKDGQPPTKDAAHDGH